jgi:hypothetical protein
MGRQESGRTSVGRVHFHPARDTRVFDHVALFKLHRETFLVGRSEQRATHCLVDYNAHLLETIARDIRPALQ